MLLNESLSPDEYVQLNDAHIKVALPAWAKHGDAKLSGYAGRLLARKDFHKSLRIDHLTVEMCDVVVPRIRDFLSQAGYDVETDLIQATIRKRGYLPYNGGILLEDGRDASEHSVLIQSLAQPHERCLIFVPDAVRDDLERNVREWIKPSQSSLAQFD